MKRFTWSHKKNEWLIENRKISFDAILQAIGSSLLDVRMNRSSKHKNQKIFIVNIDGYPWIIPFKESNEEIHLITAFPSRDLKEEFNL